MADAEQVLLVEKGWLILVNYLALCEFETSLCLVYLIAIQISYGGFSYWSSHDIKEMNKYECKFFYS